MSSKRRFMVRAVPPSFRNGSLFPIQPTLEFIHRDRRFPATRFDEIPESRTCSPRCCPHSEATDSLESVVVLRGLILVAIAHGADEPLVPGRMFAPGEDVERSDEPLGRSRPEQVGSRSTSPDVGTQPFPEQFGKVLMLHGMGFEHRHIVHVPNQRRVLTGLRIENAPGEGADLVRRGLRGSNATDSRNLGMFPPRFGDERPQGPVLWFKHRTSKRHFELERGPKSRRDGGTRRITHVTTEEATLVPWLNSLVGKRPVIAGANRLDDRASVAPASGSADAGLGKRILKSRSSEKRRMRPYPLERLVPPEKMGVRSPSRTPATVATNRMACQSFSTNDGSTARSVAIASISSGSGSTFEDGVLAAVADLPREAPPDGNCPAGRHLRRGAPVVGLGEA